MADEPPTDVVPRCPACGTVLLGSDRDTCINCHRYVTPEEADRG